MSGRPINRENVELPTGRIEGDATELSIRTSGLLSSVDEFNNVIIKDVRTASWSASRMSAMPALGAENERTILRRDGIPMVGVVDHSPARIKQYRHCRRIL